MKKQEKIKGSFEDLKPALKSLKSLMETIEDNPVKPDMYDLQEKDLDNIKKQGFSNNN